MGGISAVADPVGVLMTVVAGRMGVGVHPRGVRGTRECADGQQPAGGHDD